MNTDMNNARQPSGTTGEPVISVVMPALNAGVTIGEALESLTGQVPGLEVIVADGGSTDDTVAIARRFPFARVLSAPGTSIYQALNLAVADARAPVVAWLNADDRFLPGMLAQVLDAFTAAPDAEIVRGTPLFIRSDATGWQSNDGRIEAKAAGALSLALITRGPLAINSMVFRRSALARIGPFDTSLRLAADREWMLRAWCAGVRVVEMNRPLYCYRVHSGSSTLDPGRRNHLRAREEHAAILRRLLPLARAGGSAAAVRGALRHWHAVECALRLRALVSAGEWRMAARICRESLHADPAWPLILAGQIAENFGGTRIGREG
jgi:glycosyltransferase involved in cell wall biosynthesis